MEKANINKVAIADLIRLKDEFNSVVESLELMNDGEFMDSFNKSKEQIANSEFANWDEL